MNSYETSNRTCNYCKRSDVTDFSKCKYCGERYGTAPPPPQKTYLTEKALAVAVAAILMMCIVHHERSKSAALRKTTLAAVVQEVGINHRPLVLEFGAEWCGACRAYAPVIEAAKIKYPGIDFIRYDLDNPKTTQIARALGVSAIPVTCIFDRNGKLVKQEVGALWENQLDDQLKPLLR
jgi:thioredoxin-like negative regulator of GroEL